MLSDGRQLYTRDWRPQESSPSSCVPLAQARDLHALCSTYGVVIRSCHNVANGVCETRLATTLEQLRYVLADSSSDAIHWLPRLLTWLELNTFTTSSSGSYVLFRYSLARIAQKVRTVRFRPKHQVTEAGMRCSLKCHDSSSNS